MTGRDLLLRERAKSLLSTAVVRQLSIEEIVAFLKDIAKARGRTENLAERHRRLLSDADDEATGELVEFLEDAS